MFDELDDPRYTGPRAGSREHVATRAARIRRNRRAGWSAGVASAAAAALLVASLAGDPLATRPVEPVTTGSATPAESPTSTPSPTPSPSATTARPTGAAPQGTVPPSPVGPPSVTPTAAPGSDLAGRWLREGWADACRPATALAEGDPAYPHLKLTLEAPDVIDGSAPGTARLTLTNTYENGYVIDFTGPHGGPLTPTLAGDDAAFNGMPYDADRDLDNPNSTGANLDPGESATYDIPILLDTCAPERTAAAVGEPAPLAPGTYRMAVTIFVQRDTFFPAYHGSPSPTPSPGDERAGRLYSSEAVTITVH